MNSPFAPLVVSCYVAALFVAVPAFAQSVTPKRTLGTTSITAPMLFAGSLTVDQASMLAQHRHHRHHRRQEDTPGDDRHHRRRVNTSGDDLPLEPMPVEPPDAPFPVVQSSSGGSGTTSQAGGTSGEANTGGSEATTAPQATAPATAPQAEGTAGSSGGANSREAPSEEEPDIELLRHRERLTRTHRVLGISTWVSMGLTTALGTMVLLNRPTWIGQGLCSSMDGFNVLGDFGCGPLTAIHQISATITMGMYVTTGIFALTMPDPEHAAAGNDSRGSRLRWHKAAAWVHMIGMILAPLLGVAAVVPGALGIPAEMQADLSVAFRSVHAGVGYITFAALTAAMFLEL